MSDSGLGHPTAREALDSIDGKLREALQDEDAVLLAYEKMLRNYDDSNVPELMAILDNSDPGSGFFMATRLAIGSIVRSATNVPYVPDRGRKPVAQTSMEYGVVKGRVQLVNKETASDVLIAMLRFALNGAVSRAKE